MKISYELRASSPEPVAYGELTHSLFPHSSKLIHPRESAEKKLDVKDDES